MCLRVQEKKEKAEEKVEKKEKKVKKEKKDKEVEVVVEEVKSKKDKKDKKEKKREAEEPVVETKKDKKSKKNADEDEEEESSMKVHKKSTPEPAAAAAPAEATCEVFMGNLSFQIDEASLQDAFKECGTITNCKWLEHSDTGKFKGCGFITFSSPEEAVKAVAMNGTDVLGRAIKVDFSSKPAGAGSPRGGAGGGREVRPMQAKPEGCNTLFAGNLSFDIDDDKIKEFFSECGEITSIRWLTDKETQQFKGCGFVEFADPDAALDKAAKLNGVNLLGRSIRLDYAAPRAPKW
jgi:nucleolin